MMDRRGLSLIEVLVAMALLAIISVAVVGLLPLITQTTEASFIDASEGQTVTSALEAVGDSWTNLGPWNAESVGDENVVAYLEARVGPDCFVGAAGITEPATDRRRIVVTCPASGALPERTYRAEFGNPYE